MSQRLTPKWTPTLDEAFGKNGRIGQQGEKIVCSLFEQLGYDVDYRPSHKGTQTSGIDFFATKHGTTFSVDVKTNLNSGNYICVDHKIFESEADFWFHLNKDDHSDHIMYFVEDMINLIDDKSLRPKNIEYEGFILIKRDDVESFKMVI